MAQDSRLDRIYKQMEENSYLSRVCPYASAQNKQTFPLRRSWDQHCPPRTKVKLPKQFWRLKRKRAGALALKICLVIRNIALLREEWLWKYIPDHLPRPLTAVSLFRISASLALISIVALNSPLMNFSESPLMYSAFRSERPAWRRKGTLQAATWAGVGKLVASLASPSAWKRPINFLLIDEAAAPETCWAMILLQRLLKGSISSDRLSGEKTRQ